MKESIASLLVLRDQATKFGRQFIELRYALLGVDSGSVEPVFVATFVEAALAAEHQQANYGRHRFGRLFAPIEDLEDALTDWFETGCLFGLPLSKPNSVDGVRRYDRRREDWPYWQCTIGYSSGSIADLSSPIRARGLLPFRDAWDAVAHWVGSGTNWNVAHGRFVVPDTRARFKPPHWGNDLLRLSVEGSSDLALTELQVRRDDRSGSEFYHQPADQPIEIPYNANTLKISAFALLPDGSTADCFIPRRLGAMHSSDAEPRLVQLAYEDIPGGESERVEFKEFIRPKNKKASDLVRTTVAFANSGGGRIYVGITDYGQPQGENLLNSAMQGPNARVSVVAWTTKLLRENVVPTPELTIDVVDYLGHPVLVIVIEDGKNKPYATTNKEIFIRRGATCCLPDPHVELPTFFKQDHASPLRGRYR